MRISCHACQGLAHVHATTVCPEMVSKMPRIEATQLLIPLIKNCLVTYLHTYHVFEIETVGLLDRMVTTNTSNIQYKQALRVAGRFFVPSRLPRSLFGCTCLILVSSVY